jgi:hypothetical protein
MKKSNSLSKNFCHCIKKVRKTVKLRRGQKNTPIGREKAAIGICVKSVIQTKGKTLRKFKCGRRPHLMTQKYI